MKDRTFEDVVRSIAASEADVDKVLDAARLDRCEGPGRHMTGDQKFQLLIGALVLIGFLGFMAMMLLPRML